MVEFDTGRRDGLKDPAVDRSHPSPLGPVGGGSEEDHLFVTLDGRTRVGQAPAENEGQEAEKENLQNASHSSVQRSSAGCAGRWHDAARRGY